MRTNPVNPNLPNSPKVTVISSPLPESTWFRRLLEAFTLVLGPGILVEWVLHRLGYAEYGEMIAIAVVAACTIILYFQSFSLSWFLTRKRSLMPWFIIIALSIALWSALHRPADVWAQWGHNLNRSVDKCLNESDMEPCIIRHAAEAIAKRPTLEDLSRSTSDLTGDLVAGQTLLSNKEIAKVLDKKLSIRAEFVGVGYTRPLNSTFEEARIREYFVPNLRDTSPQIWKWQFDVGESLLRRPVAKILRSKKPANSKNKDFPVGALSGKVKTLIRFAFLHPNDYSQCLGRSSATHVFMSDLHQVAGLNLTVGEAAHYSGVSRKIPDQGEQLYIWVYEPAGADFVPATWDSVLSNFATWTGDSGCPNH
jgi:hypothetical protein